MKKTFSLLAIALFSNLITAQTTSIPDPNFEEALIDLGHDVGPIDGVVLTANIDDLEYLNVDFYSITDLTGIEDFTALTELHCYTNDLTSLDVSQNTALVILYCERNQIVSLDISENILLTDLGCWDNELTSLDVSQNVLLTSLGCSDNQLTNLDISQNTELVQLFCNNNQLTCLNAKNGNNENFTYFNAQNNPYLTCIEVDDVAVSTADWTGTDFTFDPEAEFSADCDNLCSTVGMTELSTLSLNIYPNPTTGTIHVDLGELKTKAKLTLINSLGESIFTQQFESTYVLDINAPSGIYFLQVETNNGEIETIKIIKE